MLDANWLYLGIIYLALVLLVTARKEVRQMSEETGLIILAGFVIVSFTIRQIVKYRSDKKDKE